MCDENLTKQVLDGLIKKDIELKKSVTAAREKLNNLQAFELRLNNSNEILNIELENLEKENRETLGEIAMKNELLLKLQDESKSYEERHKQEEQKFMQYFTEETEKYRTLFMNAESDYSEDNLKKDIEHYSKLSENLQESIEIIEKRMNETGEEDEKEILKELDNFNKILIESSKSVSLSIRSKENKLRVFKSKLREKRGELEKVSKQLKH